jgi:hypothetical protein
VTPRKRPLPGYAWFALCVFLCGWVVPFFEAHPLGFDDDAACDIQISRDGFPQKVSPVDSSDRAPAHCVLCHLMRALNGSHIAGVAQVAAPASDRVTIPAQPDPLVSAFPSTSTSRGPPARA